MSSPAHSALASACPQQHPRLQPFSHSRFPAIPPSPSTSCPCRAAPCLPHPAGSCCHLSSPAAPLPKEPSPCTPLPQGPLPPLRLPVPAPSSPSLVGCRLSTFSNFPVAPPPVSTSLWPPPAFSNQHTSATGRALQGFPGSWRVARRRGHRDGHSRASIGPSSPSRCRDGSALLSNVGFFLSFFFVLIFFFCQNCSLKADLFFFKHVF